MEEYKINDKTISFPSSWEDCSWEKFMQFVKLSESIDSQEKIKGTDQADEWEQTLKDLKNNTKVLSFWCGLPESEISLMDLDIANDVMTKLTWVGESYKPINIDSFTLGTEKFYLPEKLMSKGSFGRFIEAEQLELQSNMLENGVLEILPRQIAILCKKEGEEEKLDDALIDKRAEMFKKLDMATIWDVAFFLNKLEQKLMISFLTSRAKEETQKQKLQQKEQ